MASEWPVTEQEMRMQELFTALEKLLRKAEKAKNPDKMHGFLKDTTVKLKECKALLKDFEREARTDGMPAQLLAQRKKTLADQLNVLINRKKEVGQSATKDELLAGAVVAQEENLEQMSVQQLMQKGRRDLADTDATLNRAERLVEDTMQTGTQTAAALNDQTNQLNKIVDDLADIEFNVKKASKVIRDITRGLLTDKCIGFLLFACVCGVIAVIVLKVVNPRKSNISDGINTIVNTTAGQTVQQAIQNAQNAATNAVTGGSSPPASGRRQRSLLLLTSHLLPSSGAWDPSSSPSSSWWGHRHLFFFSSSSSSSAHSPLALAQAAVAQQHGEVAVSTHVIDHGLQRPQEAEDEDLQWKGRRLLLLGAEGGDEEAAGALARQASIRGGRGGTGGGSGRKLLGRREQGHDMGRKGGGPGIA